MRELELLAPARNADIGIAAIDCGADAVYIAAPKFGARQAAGNSIEDIAGLCSYAHRFGARIFVTLNTILYENELEEAQQLMYAVQEAGADAIIVQDPSVIKLAGLYDGSRPLKIPLHASTQCAIRTPEKARFLESLGFSRLILERELSLEQIRAISASVDCEIEFFVHGALCVCYSGQCYLSEKISERSANRGACIQACRARYDLVDDNGKIIVRNKALLSLKDYNLKARLSDLTEAGVSSFKIEGRLKNASYVKNVVRDYSLALDEIIANSGGNLRRASFGKVSGGFTPDTDKTFNRGYTELFIDGKRGKWASMDAAKSMGEELGTVFGLSRDKSCFTIRPVKDGIRLNNGDGLSFVSKDSEITGVRADVCNGLTIKCKRTPSLYEGARIYRNLNIAFEKEIETRPCRRLIGVEICLSTQRLADGAIRLTVCAKSEDGREVSLDIPAGNEIADNRERMRSLLTVQLGKTSGHYDFHLKDISNPECLPVMPASAINSIRRMIADNLDTQPCNARALYNSPDIREIIPEDQVNALKGKTIDYKANIANTMSESLYRAYGAQIKERAYELTHRSGAELMRTKYCIRYELGICPKFHGKKSGPLYLVNNGRRLTLNFDCGNCEMSVTGQEL